MHAAEPTPEPWLAAADARLGDVPEPVPRLGRVRRVRLLDALSWLARPGHESPDASVETGLAELAEALGLDTERGRAAREFVAIADSGIAAGLSPGALPHVVQAYVRAVGRVVAVESSVALDVLRQVEEERRPAVIADLLDTLLPISRRGFDVLHRAMLRDALAEAASDLRRPADVADTAIGMVDLVGSTGFLTSAGPLELEQLVDAIFLAGQGATAGRPAHVVKYVGDGVFLAGNDVTSVADAALEVIERLEAALPIRARGGIGYGRVLHRAGDVFGLPVNLSQALTKAARPGTVLLSADAAARVPAARRGRLRPRELPQVAFGEQLVATLRAAEA